MLWRATRTPRGPVTVRYAIENQALSVAAWGPGSEWAVVQARELVCEDDDDSGFVSHHRLIGELRHRFPGLRPCRTAAVFEAVLPTILEQKVPVPEAMAAYQALVMALGEPAPGPHGLLLQPSPSVLARAQYWALHPLGIERRRAETIQRAAVLAGRLEEAVGMDPVEARRRLQLVPGLGPWSAAEVAQVALGDPDAVSVGDYHLPHTVAWALKGVARSNDEEMLRLLEPYRGHRGRVQRLLEVSGISAPRFGPRMRLRRIADQ